MNLGDLFRSVLGFPGRSRHEHPPDVGTEENHQDFFNQGRRPDYFGSRPPSFFFEEFPNLGRHREHEEDPDEEHTDLGGQEWSYHWSSDPGFHSSAPSEMFRHFDDMFRSFDEVFKSMGMAEFSQVQPALPPNEQPPAERKGNLRDSMLKTPNSHHRDNSEGQQPGQALPAPGSAPKSSEDPPFSSFFGRLWPMPKWSQPVMPQDPMDSDLDEAVGKNGIMTILQPSKVDPAPFSGIHIMEPNQNRDPDGYIKQVQVYTYRGADGKSEERQTVEDGRGNRETTVTCTIDDQTHTVKTKRSETGNMERKEDLHNMDENDKNLFEQRWREPPQLGISANPNNRYDNQPGMIFDMFRKGFPGFPSKS